MPPPLDVDDNLVKTVGMLACGLLLVSAVSAYVFIRPQKWNNCSRLPYLPAAVPLIGNTLELATNVDRYHEWLAGHSLDRDGKPFALYLLGKNDVLYTARPEHFEEVLKTQNANFIKSDSVREIFDDFLGEDIVLLNAERWQFHRKLMAGLLTPRALREYMTPIIQDHVLQLQAVLKKACQTKETFDLHRLMRQFTLDTFVEIGFGCRLELLVSGKEHPFEIAFDDANRISSDRFTKPTWLWKLQRLLNVGSERRLREAIGEMDEFIVRLILNAIEQTRNDKDKKTENDSGYNNIMSIILKRKQAISPTLVRDITLTGLETGRNTTADTLSWLFHLLSLNSRVEQKLRAEILTKLPLKKSEIYVPSYEDIQELPYLEATIREVIRLFPTVPVIPYHCNHDTVLQDDTFIPAGTDVFLHLYSAGRLTSVWGVDAGSFNPERFIDEQTGKLLPEPPAKYSAFSSGPRVCLGRNLALLEMKISIATVISSFQLIEEPGQDVRPILDLTIGMKSPLIMHVESAD